MHRKVRFKMPNKIPDCTPVNMIVRGITNGKLPTNSIFKGQYLLAWAARLGKTSIVYALIKRKANLNKRCHHNCTALIRCAQYGYVDILRILIDAGADLNL